MPEDVSLPSIYLAKEKVDGVLFSKTVLEVKGQTLDECREHFDELKKEMI